MEELKLNTGFAKLSFNIFLVLAMFFLIIKFSFALPLPVAIAGELSGNGSEFAYVYITAYDQEHDIIHYYKSMQANENGIFVDVLTFDSSSTIRLVVQILQNGGNSSLVVIERENVQTGDYEVFTYDFDEIETDDTEETNDTVDDSSGSSRGSGGGGSGGGSGSSTKTVDKEEITDTTTGPNLDEIFIPEESDIQKDDTSSSPLGNEDLEDLNNQIENSDSKAVVGSAISDGTDYDKDPWLKRVINYIINLFKQKITSLMSVVIGKDIIVLLLWILMLIILLALFILYFGSGKKNEEEEEE